MADEIPPMSVEPSQGDATPSVPAIASVPAPVPAPDPYADRFERLERQLATITGQLVNVQQAAAPASNPQELKDEELWALAQQGNRQAFEMYMQRIAQRTSGTQIAHIQQQQAVEDQLRALYTKYPELGNPNHPLTQRAIQFKAALIQMGSPVTLQTDLDAILRAVADSRELFAPRATPSSVAPPVSQMTPQHRQTEPTTPIPPVTPEERALASKMGAKDPAKAKERFWARNAEGRSAVSPTIAAALERQ